MAVYRRKDRDTWMARLAGPDGRVVSKSFAKRSDAARWHADMLAKRERGVFLDPSGTRTTFQAYYQEWSERQVWEATTVKQMRYAVACVTFSDVPLARIRRSHIESWIKGMSRTLAPSTIKGRLRSIRSVFRAAVRDQLIAADPTDGVVVPRQRRKEAAMVIPTADELRALLDAAEPGFRPFIALCAFAGLRQGEAAATQVGDVDFLGRQLHVRRQIQVGENGALEVRPPKYGSERTIYIPEALVLLLAQHVEGCDLWLFPSGDGGPIHENTTRYRWNKAAKEAGVSGLGLHSLRHYFASTLLHSGCDVVTVSRAMGHASPSTTLNTYSHWIATAEDRTRTAIGAAMACTIGTGSAPRSARQGSTRS
jgi:integrase